MRTPAAGASGVPPRHAGPGSDAAQPSRAGGGVVTNSRQAPQRMADRRASGDSKVGQRLAGALAAAKEGEDAYQKALREGRLWRVVANTVPILQIPNGPVVAVAEQAMMGVQAGRTVVDSFGAEWLPITLMDDSVGFSPVVLRRYTTAKEEVVRCWEYVPASAVLPDNTPPGDAGSSAGERPPQHGRRAGPGDTAGSPDAPKAPPRQRRKTSAAGSEKSDSHLPTNTPLAVGALPSPGFMHGFQLQDAGGQADAAAAAWNTRWQTLIERPVLHTADGDIRRWRTELRELYDEFCSAAAQTVATIVTERLAREEALSDATGGAQPPAMTIRPLGGAAGEQLYIHRGMLLEVASEAVGYGRVFKSALAAAKAAGCHVRHMSVLHSTRHPLIAPALTCAVTHLGWRVLCTAVLPVSPGNLAAGSNDGGKTLHSRCRAGALPPVYTNALLALGGALGVRPHTVLPTVASTSTNVFGETTTAPLVPVTQAFAADVQVHAGGDGRVYVTNALRLLPAALPFTRQSSGWGVRQRGYRSTEHLARLAGPRQRRDSAGDDTAPGARRGSGGPATPTASMASTAPSSSDTPDARDKAGAGSDPARLMYRFARPEALAAFRAVGVPVCGDPFSDLVHGADQQREAALGAACLTQFTRARLCEHVARILSTLELPEDFPTDKIEREEEADAGLSFTETTGEAACVSPTAPAAAGDTAEETLLSPLKRPTTSGGRARCLDCATAIARRSFRFTACTGGCCRLCTGCYLARWTQEDGGGALVPLCGAHARDLAGMPMAPSVPAVLHHYGVNLRHLGVVYSSLTTYRAAVQHYLKIEMVARAFRQCLWGKIKKSGGSGVGGATKAIGAYLKHLFLLTPPGTTPSAELWWREELAPSLVTKYSLHMPLPTDGIDRTLLLEHVLALTGVRVTEAFTQLVWDGASDGRVPASVVRGVSPVVKRMDIDDATPLPPDLELFEPLEKVEVGEWWTRQLKVSSCTAPVPSYIDAALKQTCRAGAPPKTAAGRNPPPGTLAHRKATRRASCTPLAQDLTPGVKSVGLTNITVPLATIDYRQEPVEVVYTIKCSSGDDQWTVEKRFSECRQLHRKNQQLLQTAQQAQRARPARPSAQSSWPWSWKSEASRLPAFPSALQLGLFKTNNSKKRIEARRCKLERYLAELVIGADSLYETRFQVRAAVNEFIERDPREMQGTNKGEAKVYKSVWLGTENNVEHGRNIRIRLPTASVTYGPLGAVYELLTPLTGHHPSRRVLRYRYLQLAQFHTWMLGWKDRIPTRKDAMKFLFSVTGRPVSQDKPARPAATWPTPQHFVQAPHSDDAAPEPLPSCRCTARLVCTQPNMVNVYDTYAAPQGDAKYQIAVTPPPVACC